MELGPARLSGRMSSDQARLSKLNKNVVLLQRQIQTLDQRIAHLLQKINSKSVDYTKASLFLGKIIHR